MSEVIHDGHYTEQKVYTRPPNTYTCDSCGNNLGLNKGIELGLSYDLNDHDTEYENANFCDFKCLFAYSNADDSKRFTRAIRASQKHDLYINGFSWKDLGMKYFIMKVEKDLAQKL